MFIEFRFPGLKFTGFSFSKEFRVCRAYFFGVVVLGFCLYAVLLFIGFCVYRALVFRGLFLRV